MSKTSGQICFAGAVVSHEEFQNALNARMQVKREKLNAAPVTPGADNSVRAQIAALEIENAQLRTEQCNREANSFAESVAAAMPRAKELINQLVNKD